MGQRKSQINSGSLCVLEEPTSSAIPGGSRFIRKMSQRFNKRDIYVLVLHRQNNICRCLLPDGTQADINTKHLRPFYLNWYRHFEFNFTEAVHGEQPGAIVSRLPS